MKWAPLPATLNPWRLAKSGAVVNGSVAVSQLARLVELLALDAGVVEVKLVACKDEQYRVHLEGELKTTLTVYCQLCLQPMEISIAHQFNWLVVKTEEQANNALELHEPVFADDDWVDLKKLIEDEVLLELPIAPSHHFNQGCQTHQSFAGEVKVDKVADRETIKPFADLKDLLSHENDKR